MVSHTFPFYNSGDSLSRVVTSCGCTASLPSGKEIPPGEKGWIKVEFNVGIRLGETAEEVYVHSNDPEEPVVTLRLVGKVRQDSRASGRVLLLSRLAFCRKKHYLASRAMRAVIEQQWSIVTMMGKRLR